MPLADATKAWSAEYGRGWTPDPQRTVSEWANDFRWLSPESSANAFRWRNDTTPYLVAIMDDLTPTNPTMDIVFMKGSQIGATEAGNNWIGYVIHYTPGPIQMVRPTVGDAKKARKMRLTPMFRDTPVLSAALGPQKSRDARNTQLLTLFPGGALTLTGANVVADLKSSAQRFLFCDEIDEYDGDLDGQGDPIDIVMKRTLTYKSRRKSFLVSTPSIKGMSRIEKAYLASDRRRFEIQCPHCKHWDYLTWAGKDAVCGEPGTHHSIRWDADKPETARMACGGCDRDVPETMKGHLFKNGRWRATAVHRTHGYHLSGLYSPWLSWADVARDFLEVKNDPFRLRVWVNQILGETYEERGDAIEPESILARLEEYAAEVPNGVGFITSSTDVQDDRLETLVLGWGVGEECWVLDHQVHRGDTGSASPWAQLDRYLKSKWRHENGALMSIEVSTVDANFRTQEVYQFCKARARRKVFAVRGGRETKKPIVQHVGLDKRYRVKVFTLCTDTAKDVLFARLRIRPVKEGGSAPGLVHFPVSYGGGPPRPEARGVDEEFAEQATAERAIWEWDKRKGPQRIWYKLRERNEILDCFVYGHGALHIAGPGVIRDLGRRARRWSIKVKNPKPKPETVQAVVDLLEPIVSALEGAAPDAKQQPLKRDKLLDEARARARRNQGRAGRGGRGGWIRKPFGR